MARRWNRLDRLAALNMPHAPAVRLQLYAEAGVVELVLFPLDAQFLPHDLTLILAARPDALLETGTNAQPRLGAAGLQRVGQALPRGARLVLTQHPTGHERLALHRLGAAATALQALLARLAQAGSYPADPDLTLELVAREAWSEPYLREQHGPQTSRFLLAVVGAGWRTAAPSWS